MVLLEGVPAGRTGFVADSSTWLLFPGGLKLRRNWRGPPAEVLSNVRSHMALEAVGIEASDQVARTGGMCRFGANRGGEIWGPGEGLRQTQERASGCASGGPE